MLGVHPVDEGHQVLTLESLNRKRDVVRRKPCDECPWRKDAPVGAFPAEAFRHSAVTAHDMSSHRFSCHMSGAGKPATCAGFLLRGAENNLAIRVAIMEGRLDPSEVTDGGVPLYEGYRSMAIANGVAPDDPAIARCRGDDEVSMPHIRDHER
ncbi:MAG: hypothetical protein DI537_10430 [Stutzerimonas stutzeri]|nr:MAG: hypothetical protein DI537_10430 [Stutzerimonas stutzeri]